MGGRAVPRTEARSVPLRRRGIASDRSRDGERAWRERRGTLPECPPARPPDFGVAVIAYHVLCHDNFRQVALLVESLLADDVTVLIDIDDGKRPDTRPIEAVARCPNVHVRRDAAIGWGAGGTLRKTLRGALELLDTDSSWRYYVVLSGQDLPIASDDVIRERLAAGDAERTSFIRCHRAEPVALESLPISNPTPELQLWGDRGHTKVYARPGTIDPQMDMYARSLVDVAEVGEKGETYVGVADPLLLARRGAFFERHPFHIGANWFSLHRSLLEHLRSDPFAYELYDVLRTTFIPDESYFQTYIANSPFRERRSQDYGRLILRPGPVPRVKVLDIGDRDAIAASDALYARKFDTRHDARIVREVLDRRGGPGARHAA